MVSPAYRSVPAHDELHRDGESLVLHDGQVQRVSPLGTVIRQHAEQPRTVDELTALLEQTFGVPPEGDAGELTTRAVATLVQAGLLEQVEQP